MLPKFVVFSSILVVALAQVPIPKRMLGYTYGFGAANASVQIEIYMGPLCPDSKEAFPTLVSLADYYGPNNLRLVTHLFPLPYHHNSFIAAKGANIVASLARGQNNKTDHVYDWIKNVYANIDSFGNIATYQMSQKEVEQKFAELAGKMGISTTSFSSSMADETIEENTRLDWKYTATRGIAWTPAFMVNDVLTQASPDWTLSQWRQLIGPLLGDSVKSDLGTGVTCKLGEKHCEYLPGKVECCKSGEACIPNVGCRC